MGLPAEIGAAGINLIGNQIDAASARNQARLNRVRQEQLSSSAHQREMADLKKAGLNPYLTAMGGHGASTPSGSQAQPVSSARGVVEAAQSAVEMSEMIKNNRVNRLATLENTAKTVSERRLINNEANNAKANLALIRQHVGLATEEQTREWLKNQLLGSEVEWMNDIGDGKTLDLIRGELQAALTGGEKQLQDFEIRYGQKMGAARPYLQMMMQLMGGGAAAGMMFKAGKRFKNMDETMKKFYK